MFLSNRGAFISLLLFVFIAKDVTSWTVDLPEVRKYFFEKYSKDENKNNDVVIDNKDPVFDNVEGDSPHNNEKHDKNGNYYGDTKDTENDVNYNKHYAGKYKYQSYMEKKVHDIVHSGSQYLEGLSQAIEQYGELLKNCSIRFNFTESSTNSTSWQPQNETPLNLTEASSLTQPSYSDCARATKSREQVRRLAALALWASRELEDKAYDEKYGEKHSEDREEEEKELLLRLAWFLDRLATLTGFEPAKQIATTTAKAPSTILPTNAYPTMISMPEDVKRQMMECLQSNSSRAADERCRYPLPLPEDVKNLFGFSDYISPSPSPATSSPFGNSELLQPSETRESAVKSVKKRSLESPLVTIVNYYIKHKVWDGSNPTSEDSARSEDFNVKNDITYVNNDLAAIKSLKKRSIDFKTKLNQPEDPMQDLSGYVKHKKGVNYDKNEKQSEELKKYLDKLRRNDKMTDEEFVRKWGISVRNRKKRAVKYENKFKPRPSENTYQDISYYSKNKQGTQFTPNAAQAAMVRAGLEQIFQTGNMELIRRYGMNFRPEVPNPLLFGILRTMSDV